MNKHSSATIGIHTHSHTYMNLCVQLLTHKNIITIINVHLCLLVYFVHLWSEGWSSNIFMIYAYWSCNEQPSFFWMCMLKASKYISSGSISVEENNEIIACRPWMNQGNKHRENPHTHARTHVLVNLTSSTFWVILIGYIVYSKIQSVRQTNLGAYLVLRSPNEIL